jgi:hypothetical protein
MNVSFVLFVSSFEPEIMLSKACGVWLCDWAGLISIPLMNEDFFGLILYMVLSTLLLVAVYYTACRAACHGGVSRRNGLLSASFGCYDCASIVLAGAYIAVY